MLNKYDQEIELLLKWYERAKEVTIKAESLDTFNKGYIQPLHEQRYSFDHFLRAVNYEKNSNGKTDDDKNVIKAIDSVIGHLQRAYSDSIEWILVSVKDEYDKILAQYTNDQIKDAFSEYYSEIRPSMEDITEIVNEYKINKSIEEVVDSDIISAEELQKLKKTTDQFLSIDVVNKLESYLKILHKKEASLIETKKRDKKESRKEKILIPILTAIVSGVIVALIVA